MSSSINSLINTLNTTDQFLNVNNLLSLQAYTKKCQDSISKLNKKRDILAEFQKYFTFEKVFSTQGVQAITALLKTTNKRNKNDQNDDKIVCKISINLDFGVEHEDLVTKELNKLRKFS